MLCLGGVCGVWCVCRCVGPCAVFVVSRVLCLVECVVCVVVCESLAGDVVCGACLCVVGVLRECGVRV